MKAWMGKEKGEAFLVPQGSKKRKNFYQEPTLIKQGLGASLH